MESEVIVIFGGRSEFKKQAAIQTLDVTIIDVAGDANAHWALSKYIVKGLAQERP